MKDSGTIHGIIECSLMKTYPLQVVWEPYDTVQAQQVALSNECFADEDTSDDAKVHTPGAVPVLH